MKNIKEAIAKMVLCTLLAVALVFSAAGSPLALAMQVDDIYDDELLYDYATDEFTPFFPTDRVFDERGFWICPEREDEDIADEESFPADVTPPREWLVFDTMEDYLLWAKENLEDYFDPAFDSIHYEATEIIFGANAVFVTLTFDGNGGTPASQSIEREAGGLIMSFPPAPTRTGYTFVSWYDTPAATGGSWVSGLDTVPSSGATYWARWQPRPRATFVYSGNGHTHGSVPSSHYIFLPGPITFASPGNMEREGYEFVGWRRSDWPGSSFSPGTSTHLIAPEDEGTHIMEAIWNPVNPTPTPNPNHVTMTFMGNLGSPPVQHWTGQPGDPIGGTLYPLSGEIQPFAIVNTNIVMPTREGYRFRGWFPNQEGTGQPLRDNATLPSANAEVFAIWQPVITLTFNPNGGTPTTQQIFQVDPGQFIGTIPISTPSRPGFSFVGWFDAQDREFRPNTNAPMVSTTFLARWRVAAPTITNPEENGDMVLPFENLPIIWDAVPGATRYSVNITNLTTGISNFHSLGNVTSHPIPGSALNPGNEFRVRIHAYMGVDFHSASERTFRVRRTDPFFAFYGDLGWKYPLPTSAHISSWFGDTFNRAGRHEGFDIISPLGRGEIRGEAVYAAHDGIAIRSGDGGLAGYRVTLVSDVIDPTTGMNIVSRYLHLLYAPSVRVPQGSRVNQGDRLGSVGNSGSSTGYHLHMDINNRNFIGAVSYEIALDPERFFPHTTFTRVSR